MTFPDDETGEALQRRADNGADLTKPHNIDFYILVTDEAAGNAIVTALTDNGFDAALEQDEDQWNVCGTRELIPTHEAISELEVLVDSIATAMGGTADGWGAFAVE